MKTNEDEERALSALSELLGPIFQAVTSDHDLSHVSRMLNIAERIVGEDTDLFLLKVAVWFHDLHRAGFVDKYIGRYIKNVLVTIGGFSEEEICLVIDAVEKHSFENDESDSPLLRDLKDADRLDGRLIKIMRCCAGRSNLPFYLSEDFVEDPSSPADQKNFRSVVQDIRYNIRGLSMLRNPKAQRIGERTKEFYLWFLQELEEEVREFGEI